MAERTFDDFNEFASDYRSIHSGNIKLSGADSFYFAEMKVLLLKEFEGSGKQEVLDIGCGDGATEIFMQQYFPLWHVTAIDVSEKSIAEARAKKISNSVFEVYNGTAIPLPNNSVDIVFIAGVLHHVEFALHQVLIAEIVRVLKKGGRLYLFEHNPLNPVTRYLVNTCVFDKNARLLKSSYTSKLLKQVKLCITHKTFIIFFPRKGLFSNLIFLEKYLQWLPAGGQYFIRAMK